ncbi:adenosine deaminase family protein [Granulicella arctica]|uniref:adenosine deaminase n=1 Tax=Granulicella arctica TaxID=940613 RepID=A0A7Y9TG42_9BACT|nr:adenosine deaminase [Granulicella arctica]NYF79074.1 adenosine deaminase [Granulicella arctica]
MRTFFIRFASLTSLLCLGLPALTQTTPQEQRAARAFHEAKASPLELHVFLSRMPKGADLHMHLSGAVYAETFIQDAIADNLCANPVTLSFTKNIGLTSSLPAQPICAEGQVAVATALKDQKLYDGLVDSFSMRGFVPTPGFTGHDQFFATFGRFGNMGDHIGEWLDEVATRAATQNEQYLEIMSSPSSWDVIQVATQIGWPTGPSDPIANPTGDATGASPAELAHLRDQILASPVFRDTLAQDRKEIADASATRNRIERCGQPNAAPACAVQIRFLGQVARAFPPARVFAQTLLYFELASVDPSVVGINFVQPEDAYMSMSEYHRQMLMLDYLHSVYPKVHITLHAGELAPGLVPPAGLSFHIREAVDLAHAERIGHGVDIMQENNPHALLKQLADHHTMIEINLTSNDVILGITEPNHPLPIYRAAHVPVALSTDDEGVSRIDLTNEYTRAALEYNLTYADLKAMARTSLEHSFLTGPSLWQQQDNFTRVIPACATVPLGAEKPTEKCAVFLKSSDKATQQWELEHRYKVFESNLP